MVNNLLIVIHAFPVCMLTSFSVDEISLHNYAKWSTTFRVGCILVVKAMDCGIVVSEFVLQSRYYIHFRANTLGKGMNLLILPAMG